MLVRSAIGFLARGFAPLVIILAITSCAGQRDSLGLGPVNDVESIELVSPPTSLFVDETYRLVAVTRNAAGGQSSATPVKWRSSDSHVATVSQGIVSARGVGTAEITAEAEGKTGSTVVTVVAMESLLSVDRFANGALGFSSTRETGALNLCVVGPDGVHLVTSLSHHVQFDGWSPDGTHMAAIRFPVGTDPFTSHVVKSDGTDDVLIDDAIVNWSPDWLHRGEVLDGQMTIANADGSGEHHVGPAGFVTFGPWWSPDGTRVAFAYAASASAPSDIYVAAMDGSGLLNLTSSPSVSEEFASWSPDGQRLAITGENPSTGLGSSVFVVNATGTSLLQLTSTVPPRGDVDPEWSPDGKRIAFTSHIGNDVYSLWVMNADSGTPIRMAPATMTAGFARWSPDGSTLAFTGIAENSLHQDIFVVTADRRQLIRLTRGSGENLGPFWRPKDFR